MNFVKVRENVMPGVIYLQLKLVPVHPFRSQIQGMPIKYQKTCNTTKIGSLGIWASWLRSTLTLASCFLRGLLLILLKCWNYQAAYRIFHLSEIKNETFKVLLILDMFYCIKLNLMDWKMNISVCIGKTYLCKNKLLTHPLSSNICIYLHWYVMLKHSVESFWDNNQFSLRLLKCCSSLICH